MNGRILVGIISYLPDDLEVRDKRLTTHIKQLENIDSTFDNMDFLTIYQNYSELEIQQCEARIINKSNTSTYQTHKALGANPARNIILKEFYSSDYEFLMLMDDDTVFYPYYDVKYLFSDLLAYRNKTNIGMIRPCVPFMSPFKESNYKDRSTIEQCWILRSSMGLIPFCMIILSNLKENFGKEIFFDEVMNPRKGEGYDDYDFVFRLKEQNIPSHRCQQIVVNPLYSDSVVYSDETRRKQHIDNICNVYNRYPKLNVKYTVVEGKVKSDISKLSNYLPLYIPRQQVYVFESGMIPKSGSENSIAPSKRKLF